MIGELFSNRVLTISILSWFVAQAAKVLLVLFKQSRLDFRRFVGSGGMPSSHSAFVMALATCMGLHDGFDSPVFAFALVFALVTMYDAAGVRHAAGKQAEILNKIVDEMFLHDRNLRDKRLKELLGHTPKEVLVGALLGIFLAVLFY